MPAPSESAARSLVRFRCRMQRPAGRRFRRSPSQKQIPWLRLKLSDDVVVPAPAPAPPPAASVLLFGGGEERGGRSDIGRTEQEQRRWRNPQ